jgi:hypothetical protein
MNTNNHPELGSRTPPALLAAMKRRPALRSLLTEHPEILDMAEESSFLCDALCDSMSNLSRRLFDERSQAFADPVAYVRCAVEQDSAAEKDDRIDTTDMRLAKVRHLSVDDLLLTSRARSDRDLRIVEEAWTKTKEAAGALELRALELAEEGQFEESKRALAEANKQSGQAEALEEHAKALCEDLASDRAHFGCLAGTNLSMLAFGVLEKVMRDAKGTAGDPVAFEEHVSWFRSDYFLFWAHEAGIAEASAYGMRVIRGLRSFRADLIAAQKESDAESAPRRAKALANAQDRKAHPWHVQRSPSPPGRNVADATYEWGSRADRTTLFGRRKGVYLWNR